MICVVVFLFCFSVRKYRYEREKSSFLSDKHKHPGITDAIHCMTECAAVGELNTNC